MAGVSRSKRSRIWHWTWPASSPKPPNIFRERSQLPPSLSLWTTTSFSLGRISEFAPCRQNGRSASRPGSQPVRLDTNHGINLHTRSVLGRCEPGRLALRSRCHEARLRLPQRPLPRPRQNGPPRIDRILPEELLDAQQLIVLRQSVAAAQRAGLDLAAVGRNGNVSDGRVLGFAGTMAQHG